MVDIKQVRCASVAEGAIVLRGPSGVAWSTNTPNTKGNIAGIRVDNGTASSPSFAFNQSQNTGIFSPSSSNLAFSTGGTSRLTLNTVALTGSVPIRLQQNGVPVFTFDGDTDTGIGSSTSNTVDIITNGAVRLKVTDSVTSIYGSGALVVPTGPSSARPAPELGAIRYNTTNGYYEGFFGDEWAPLKRIGREPRTEVTTSEYTVTSTDQYIGVNHSAGTSIILPPGIVGQRVVIKDESGNADSNNITVYPYSNETIEGETSHTINVAYGKLHLIFGNGAWLHY